MGNFFEAKIKDNKNFYYLNMTKDKLVGFLLLSIEL